MRKYNNNTTGDNPSLFMIAIVAMFMLVLAIIAMLAEDAGLEREPTNKSQLCSCIIHVDSVPKPETEGV